jgi:hypothetical protein
MNGGFAPENRAFHKVGLRTQPERYGVIAILSTPSRWFAKSS